MKYNENKINFIGFLSSISLGAKDFYSLFIVSFKKAGAHIEDGN